MTENIYVNRAHVIKCCQCAAPPAAIRSLRFEKSYSLPEPGGKPSATGYFHCLCGKYLAYQQAEGRIVLSDPKYAKIVNLAFFGKTTAFVGYDRPIKELLDQGKYKSVCPDINEKNFPATNWEKELLLAPLLFNIFRVQKEVEFEELAVCLHEENHRGATLREGLGLAIEKPRIHQRMSLLLPGSGWRNQKTAYKMRQIPELYNISGSRHVFLRQLDMPLLVGTLVLAVPR